MTKYFPVFILSLCVLASGGCSGQTNATPPEVCFSPERHVPSRIIEAIDGSISSIDIAMMDFTSPEIKLALDHANKRGVTIDIITDSRQAKDKHSPIHEFLDEGFNIKTIHGKKQKITYGMFAIFDEKLLFTGSSHPADMAGHFNHGNTVFISDQATVDKYRNEFEKLWNDATDANPGQHKNDNNDLTS